MSGAGDRATDAVRVVDQQLIVHVFAAAAGPHAASGYAALRDLWDACRHLFRLDAPVTGTGAPTRPPESLADLPDPAVTGPEAILAGQECADADHQAVLRRHHDLLNLSLAVAPGPAPADPAPACWPRWPELDRQWSAVAVGRCAPLLGVVRVYLAGLAGLTDRGPVGLSPAARTAVGHALAGQLPGPVPPPRAWTDAALLGDRVLAWELPHSDDARWERRLVLAAAVDDDPTASAWAWSDGSAAIPPLARYLLHAAKVRYQLRVLRRDNPADHLRARVDALAAEVRAGTATPAQVRALGDVRRDAHLSAQDLRDMRHAVTAAADNMALAWGGCRTPPEGGLFAADRNLTDWLRTHLDDEREHVEATAARARHLTDGMASGGPASPASGGPASPVAGGPSDPSGCEPPSPAGKPAGDGGSADDTARSVFVVHGRDAAVRNGMFALLRALDLKPLEWEALVSGTGMAAPFLGDVVAHAVTRARAAVVLLTPDDVVALHPSLRLDTDEPHEWAPGMQARPNVLLELGMALAAYPDRTVIVKAGSHRPVADLDGRNFLQLRDTADFRRKLAHRLRLAGCRVDERGQDWLTAGDFGDLDAYRRVP